MDNDFTEYQSRAEVDKLTPQPQEPNETDAPCSCGSGLHWVERGICPLCFGISTPPPQ